MSQEKKHLQKRWPTQIWALLFDQIKIFLKKAKKPISRHCPFKSRFSRSPCSPFPYFFLTIQRPPQVFTYYWSTDIPWSPSLAFPDRLTGPLLADEVDCVRQTALHYSILTNNQDLVLLLLKVCLQCTRDCVRGVTPLPDCVRGVTFPFLTV